MKMAPVMCSMSSDELCERSLQVHCILLKVKVKYVCVHPYKCTFS